MPGYQLGSFQQLNIHQLQDKIVLCCYPLGCRRMYEELIFVENPGNSVKLRCSDSKCVFNPWMHEDCFRNWEQNILTFLNTYGKSKNWNEKQKIQNVWNKTGYDLILKAYSCICGNGHLDKDRDHKVSKYFSKDKISYRNENIYRPTRDNSFFSTNEVQRVNANMMTQLRLRSPSGGSTGSSTSTEDSSPPSSESDNSPPISPGSRSRKKSGEFFADAEQAAAGNIFRRRVDFNAFNCLPRKIQNPYHIKIEDEGPHGNDEIRKFVLSNLSTHQVTEVSCVSCNCSLPVYDRYPLIDGTFFLSPLRYNSDVSVTSDRKSMYLNAVCMHCMVPKDDRALKCQACKTHWNGNSLLIGTMYRYDIFAATPCCPFRLSCKFCYSTIMDNGLSFFSEYSRQIECPNCHVHDYHYVKSLDQIFTT